MLKEVRPNYNLVGGAGQGKHVAIQLAIRLSCSIFSASVVLPKRLYYVSGMRRVGCTDVADLTVCLAEQGMN